MTESIMDPKELDTAISKSKGLMVYFYNDSCAPCIALRPKIVEIMNVHFNQMKLIFINSSNFPQLSASYSVFSSPTILVFFEGKEYFRVSKYVSVTELIKKIERYYSILFE